MTGQTLLNLMEDLDNEIQAASGEANVTRALRMLNTAQDYFETLVARDGEILGSHTSTVTTTADTETTAWPTGLLRADSLWLIDADTSRPAYELHEIQQTGGHATQLRWPLQQRAVVSAGKPWGYWTNGRLLYWAPLPDAAHTVRWYGWQRQADIAAADTFAYDDGVAYPLAAFAVEIFRRGLDDPVADIEALARSVFRDQLRAMRNFTRTGPVERTYQYVHST